MADKKSSTPRGYPTTSQAMAAIEPVETTLSHHAFRLMWALANCPVPEGRYQATPEFLSNFHRLTVGEISEAIAELRPVFDLSFQDLSGKTFIIWRLK